MMMARRGEGRGGGAQSSAQLPKRGHWGGPTGPGGGGGGCGPLLMGSSSGGTRMMMKNGRPVAVLSDPRCPTGHEGWSLYLTTMNPSHCHASAQNHGWKPGRKFDCLLHNGPLAILSLEKTTKLARVCAQVHVRLWH
jgi:hypothetical protein